MTFSLKINFLILLFFISSILIKHSISAQDEKTIDLKAAASYFDKRQKAWFDFKLAKRGQGENATSCLCCHTLVSHALARPVLRKMQNINEQSDYEKLLLKQIRQRVNNWDKLDSKEFELFYDHSEEKKQQSQGTEAVLNALVLALNDNYQKQSTKAITLKALNIMWSEQIKEGDFKGSWQWLDFDLDPWESEQARYFGACTAAIALGTAPNYYQQQSEETLKQAVEQLKNYLQKYYKKQNLYNKIWALWASTKIKNLLNDDECEELIDQLFKKQNADGAWSLSSLGQFKYSVEKSDAYATGLILLVLKTAKTTKNQNKILKAFTWLKNNQQKSGAWLAYSVNKERDFNTHRGKFMSDAASAFAILALAHNK